MIAELKVWFRQKRAQDLQDCSEQSLIPIRAIKRRTGLSFNTIRKYLRADAVEPVSRVPDRPSKLYPFSEKLTGWLRVGVGKLRKQKWTAKQLYADVVSEGRSPERECLASLS